MSQQQKIRRMVWTVSIAAITATGAWYGAGLKIQQEHQETVKSTKEATTEEKIAQLEQYRTGLVGKMKGIERKLEEVEQRRNGATREESKVGRERR